jgi:hypothetical protein
MPFGGLLEKLGLFAGATGIGPQDHREIAKGEWPSAMSDV